MRKGNKSKSLLQFKIIFPLALKRIMFYLTWPETKVSERAALKNICEHNKKMKEKRTIRKPIAAEKKKKKNIIKHLF